MLAAAAASGPTTTCAGSSVVGMRAQPGGWRAAGLGLGLVTAAAGVWSGAILCVAQLQVPQVPRPPIVPLVAGRPDPSVLLKTLCEARPCQVWCIDPDKVLWRGVAAAGPAAATAAAGCSSLNQEAGQAST
ncbi:hypothetical protein Pmani_031072 [Petrolisthes manimaculis]|uniref:Uncharacterized protein n=1 Tax=Petrolisthes manimaculis TaxID=1843537 RepID=A0AAE1NW41_9EUCA|nr:hypothetical protein Pmani_031072 [Petrolisthes manimaculis]